MSALHSSVPLSALRAGPLGPRSAALTAEGVGFDRCAHRFLRVGLRTSSSARPHRVNAITTVMTPSPAGRKNHHAPSEVAPASYDDSSVWPQLTRSGSPSPRKAS